MNFLRFTCFFFFDRLPTVGKNFLQHFIRWFFTPECLEGFSDVGDNLVEHSDLKWLRSNVKISCFYL